MRKFLAGLLVIIFIPIFLIVLISFNLLSVFLDKEQVKDSLEKSGIYTRLVPVLVGDIYTVEAEIDLVTEAQLTEVLNTTFPPKTVQSEVERTIDGLYPYLLSESENFSVTYDLNGYKKTFLKEAENFILVEIISLPECTAKQLKELDLGNSDELPVCKPPGFTDAEILEGVVNGDFDELLVGIPDEIILTESRIITKPATMEFENQEAQENLFVNTRSAISNRNTAFFAGFTVLITILILIALLRWGSYKSIAKWVGWTLLLSAINFVIVSYLLYYSSTFIEISLESVSQSAALASSSFTDLIRVMFFSKALPQTIVILIISLALIIIPSFIKPKQKTEIPLDSKSLDQ